MRHAAALLVLLALSFTSADRYSFANIFGGEEAPEVPEADTNLDDRDIEQIEGAVENMAAQFKDQLKEHITEQVRASKAGGSKLAQSRIAGPQVALQAAVHNNQYEKVAKLLADGVDPNGPGPTALTPLHAAADGGYKDVVDILLAHNASVDAQGPDNASPLHLAAHKGRARVTDLLLAEGADVHATLGNSGATPLYLASEMGHTRVVSRVSSSDPNPRSEFLTSLTVVDL